MIIRLGAAVKDSCARCSVLSIVDDLINSVTDAAAMSTLQLNSR